MVHKKKNKKWMMNFNHGVHVEKSKYKIINNQISPIYYCVQLLTLERLLTRTIISK